METSWPSCFDLKSLKEHRAKVHVLSKHLEASLYFYLLGFSNWLVTLLAHIGTEMIVVVLQVLLSWIISEIRVWNMSLLG